MFEFQGPKRLLSSDEMMIAKLSMPDPTVFDFYLNSFRDYETSDARTFRRNHEFLGFLLDTYGIGLTIGEERYVAVHKFKQNWDWDYLSRTDSGKVPWILMFQGCDNSSYYMRFETEELLDERWAMTNSFRVSSEMYHYN